MTLEPEDALSTVKQLYAELSSRRKEITRLDRYYRGEQPLKYASERWREFHGNRYKDFSDNWCAPVANAPSERLRVNGIRLPTDGGDVQKALSADEKRLWDVWLGQDLEAQSSQGLLDSIVSKRSYVLVWADPDSDQPEVTWEDALQMIIGYDPEHPRRRKAALKTWRDDKVEYATLYTADQVWKFERSTGGALEGVTVMNGQTAGGLFVPEFANLGTTALEQSWQQRQPDGDDTWPLDNPMGVVPVVEFPNRPMLRAEPISEVHGAAAMQDSINLLWAYLFGAADFASLPGRVITGAEIPEMVVLDNAGNPAGTKKVDLEKLQADRFMWLTNPNAKIAEFTAAKLDVFTDVIEVSVGHIAAQTRTPPHYLASKGGLINLSGDALKAAETGLVKKVEEQQLFFGPAVREVFRLIALVLNEESLAKAAAGATTIWADAEIRSEGQMGDLLLKLKQVGAPLRWLMERYGLTPGELDRLMQMKADELAMDPIAAMAGAVPLPPVPEPVPQPAG